MLQTNIRNHLVQTSIFKGNYSTNSKQKSHLRNSLGLVQVSRKAMEYSSQLAIVHFLNKVNRQIYGLSAVQDDGQFALLGPAHLNLQCSQLTV